MDDESRQMIDSVTTAEEAEEMCRRARQFIRVAKAEKAKGLAAIEKADKMIENLSEVVDEVDLLAESFRKRELN